MKKLYMMEKLTSKFNYYWRALEDIVHKKVFDQFTKLIVLLKLGSNGSLLITKEFSVRSYTVTHYSIYW